MPEASLFISFWSQFTQFEAIQFRYIYKNKSYNILCVCVRIYLWHWLSPYSSGKTHKPTLVNWCMFTNSMTSYNTIMCHMVSVTLSYRLSQWNIQYFLSIFLWNCTTVHSTNAITCESNKLLWYASFLRINPNLTNASLCTLQCKQRVKAAVSFERPSYSRVTKTLYGWHCIHLDFVWKEAADLYSSLWDLM